MGRRTYMPEQFRDRQVPYFGKQEFIMKAVKTMKTMKNIRIAVSVFLIAALAAALAVIPASAADKPVFYLTPSAPSVRPGDTVNVVFSVENGKDLCAGEFYVQFNPYIFAWIDGAYSEAADNESGLTIVFPDKNETGEMQYEADGSPFCQAALYFIHLHQMSETFNSADVCVLTFKALAAGEGEFRIAGKDVHRVENGDEEHPVQVPAYDVRNTSVTVSSNAAPVAPAVTDPVETETDAEGNVVTVVTTAAASSAPAPVSEVTASAWDFNQITVPEDVTVTSGNSGSKIKTPVIIAIVVLLAAGVVIALVLAVRQNSIKDDPDPEKPATVPSQKTPSPEAGKDVEAKAEDAVTEKAGEVSGAAEEAAEEVRETAEEAVEEAKETVEEDTGLFDTGD